MNSIYIGDRPLDRPEDDDDIECPCGSHAYTTHGSCSHCNPDMSDPGEPNEEPDL